MREYAKRLQGRRGATGFTLVELMIVLVVIAVIIAIVVPNLISARLSANETAAVARLRTLTSAQAQFRTSGKADEDLDGGGEYGFFAELGGSIAVRGGNQKVPTDLPASMGFVTSDGEVSRAGYVFRLYLPAAGGVGTREEPTGGIALGTLDPDLAEISWVCYAWPENNGVTGNRTFFVNEHSEITQSVNTSHSGENIGAITAGAALITSNLSLMTGQLAIGTVGGDGRMWRSMNQ